MGKRKWPKPNQRWSLEAVSVDEFEPSIIAEVESLFKKQFTYNNPQLQWDLSPQESNCAHNDASQDTNGKISVWELPSPEHMFVTNKWTCPTLQTHKTKLNVAKNQLSELDITTWHSHTQLTNRAGAVIQHVRRHKKPELCTQAWCKFHEIVASFPDIAQPKDGSRLVLNSVHLCEAPGAFIASLNHFLSSNSQSTCWTWLGTTLNPYYEGNNLSEMIDDDRFISQTFNNWYFGVDNTGNIMNKENVEGLLRTACQMGPVHLVTADGSIDCANNPEEQESLTSQLHFCEVVAAVSLLGPSGALVLKMFTMFEACSVGLLYLLNCLFNKVHVVKPATSKPGNSEVYVVCLAFQGINPHALAVLMNNVGAESNDKVIFGLEDIPLSFLEQHIACCELFMRLQVQAMEENLALYTRLSPTMKQHIETLRKCCALSYVQRFGIRTLSSDRRITLQYQHARMADQTHTGYSKPRFQEGSYLQRRHQGSYAERRLALNMAWEQRVQQLQKVIIKQKDLDWLQNCGGVLDDNLARWEIVEGQQLVKIVSTKFGDQTLLKKFNEVAQHSHLKEGQMTCSMSMTKRVLEIAEEALKSNATFVVVAAPCFLLDYFKEQNGTQQVLMHGLNNQIEAGAGKPFILLHEMCDQHEELQTKHGLFNSILLALKNLKPGCALIFSLYGSHTRFTVGLLFLLHSIFVQMRILSDPCSAIRFAVCMGYQEMSQALWNHLESVSQNLAQFSGSSTDVLQFVPMQILYESTFFSYIYEANDLYLQHRINIMLEDQKKNEPSKPLVVKTVKFHSNN